MTRPPGSRAQASAAAFPLALSLLVGTTVPWGVATASSWTDISSPVVADTAATVGCALVDVDLDGDPDIHYLNNDLFDNRNPRDRLLRNDGGTFVRMAPELESPVNRSAAAWGDMDGDGDLDVYVVGYDYGVGLANRLYRNDGGTFVDVTAPPVALAAAGSAPTWVDFDLDGDLDLVAAFGLPGMVRFFLNDGQGHFADATPAWLFAYFGGVQSIAWGDWDDDGDPDPYLVRTPGSANDSDNFLLRNDGHGDFVDVTVPPLDDDGFGHAGLWGDVDNDGDLDLYVTNAFGPNRLFRNLGGGMFVDASVGDLGDPGTVAGATFGDYDNDGWIDLYTAVALAPNKLLHNDCVSGEIAFTNTFDPTVSDDGVGGGVAFGDIDEDGDLDLLLANIDELHANRLFRNDVAGIGDFVRFDLIGTVSNRFGVGARIVVEDGGLRQIREIRAGQGFCSQEPLTAHFGLGRNQDIQVDRVTVYWPSGIVQTLEGLPSTARITLVEVGPTAIRITGLVAEATPGVVVLRWESEGEMSYAGFGVERADSPGFAWISLPGAATQEGDHWRYEDRSAPPGATVRYRVAARDPAGSEEVSVAIEVRVPPRVARRLHLAAPYPNPFRSGTQLGFELPVPGSVAMSVLDVGGRRVRDVLRADLGAGPHTAVWDGLDDLGRPVPGGVYFIRLDAPGGRTACKVVRVGE